MICNYKLYSKLVGSVFVSLRATKNRSAWTWKPDFDTNFDNSAELITELNNYQLLNASIKFTNAKS